MHHRTTLPRAANLLIRQQAGVITTRQLHDFGVTSRALRRLSLPWERPARGLYLTSEPTWESAAWAGFLHAVGQGGAIGGAAACHIYGAVRDAPAHISVWATSPKSGFTVGKHRIEFRRGERRHRGSPPRTTLEDALLDMAHQSTDLDSIAAVSRALAQSLTTPSRILEASHRRTRLRHRDVIHQLCATAGIESVLEWLFQRDVVRAHGLPEPRRQVATVAGRVDVLYEEQGLVVELDGLRDHQDGSKDLFRDNEHMLAGRRAMRFGFNAVARSACRAASQVERGLVAAGWRGQLSPCGDGMDQVCGPSSVPNLDP